MTDVANAWTLLIYKIPSHPTRLRLQVWRKLQRMGALYLQDAICVVPSRPDLDENMQYIAESIAEMGGTYHLFRASTILPEGSGRLAVGFRNMADASFDEIIERIEKAHRALGEAENLAALENVEEELKRERVAYLRARRLAYLGSQKENEVEAQIDALRCTLDELNRNDK